VLQERFDLIVLSLDPARTTDNSALTPVAFSAKRGILIQFDERELNVVDKSSYIPQAEEILKIMKDLSKRAEKIVFVMDATGRDGVADLLESKGVPVFKRFKWSGGDVLRDREKYGDTILPKGKMVEAMQVLFDNKKFYLTGNCEKTIEQFSTYYAMEMGGKKVYGNKEKKQHDDFVSAGMMGAYTAYELLGVKKQLGVVIDPFASFHDEANLTREQMMYNIQMKQLQQQKAAINSFNNAPWRAFV